MVFCPKKFLYIADMFIDVTNWLLVEFCFAEWISQQLDKLIVD